MYRKISHRLALILGSAFLVLLPGSRAQAQAQCPISGSTVISCPNQIEGTLTLTSNNPTIVSVLESAGPTRGGLSVRSVGTPTVLISTSSTPVSGSNDMPYQVTVQGGEAGSGIAHDVLAGLYRQTGGQSYYVFAPRLSDPVELEPAPDVHLDFQECAGLLDIRWVGDGGVPVAVQGGRIEAVNPTDVRFGNPPGFGLSQAGQLIPAGSTGELLLVRGDGSTYRVRVFINSGTDPYSDLITIRHNVDVPVACDEVVEITIPLGSGDLGRIVGQVDMPGETERAIGIRAGDGPFGNIRLDKLLTAGPFELENLVPSNVVTPPQGYQTFGRLFLFGDDRLEIFHTPTLEHSSRPLAVGGQTTDVGDAFVIDPGYVSGAVELHGPPSGLSGGSCLQTIVQGGSMDPQEPNFRGIMLSYIEARGTSSVAPGATRSSAGGVAEVAYKGSYSPAEQGLLGDYRLALGGLDGESSIWDLQRLRIENRLAGSIVQATLTDASLLPLEIVPGQESARDFRYCYSEVNIGYRTTSGTFRSPSAGGSGSFTGTDFFGRPTSYSVTTHGNGVTLPNFNAPSDWGRFTLCLPQATYTLTPGMLAINPDGTISQITLRPITFEAGCGQVIDLSLGLQLSLDSLPQCSATAPRLTGQVRSDGPVDRIFAQVNGGAESPICTNCGEDPAFDATAPAVQCDNTIVVTAQAGGETSSATAFTRVDGTAPVFSGCQDVTVDSEPGGQGATVFFNVGTEDNCDGSRPATCDHPSGSFFGPGTTAVTCRSADRCGNEQTCTFHVTVNTASPLVVAVHLANVTVNEGQTATNTGTVSGGNGGPVSLAASVGTITNHGDGTWSWSFPTNDGPPQSQTVTITADDGSGGASSTSFALVVNNLPPVITSVSNNGPITVGGSATISVAATDPAGANDPLTYQLDCDNDSVFEVGPQASPDAACTFASTGLFTVNVRVADGDGGVATGSTVVRVNPDCSTAVASSGLLWPPNHNLVPIQISGVTSGGSVTISVTSIFQDEPVRSPGSGSTAPDGTGVGTSTPSVRAEREGGGNGRVYHIAFTGTDATDGTCTGAVTVGVPKSQGHGAPIDGGPLYDSTLP
ncbi:MAG TPA: HYR domain-containing protein [Thermoanaerobaculia bacterium]